MSEIILHYEITGNWLCLLALLAGSLVAGAMGLWRQRPIWVFLAGLLLNIAATVVWLTVGRQELVVGLQLNAICLAVNVAIWTTIDCWYPAGVPHATWAGRPVRFAHLAAILAVVTVFLVSAADVAPGLVNRPYRALLPIDWIALSVTTIVVAFLLRASSAPFKAPCLYALGLAAINLFETTRALYPGQFLVWAIVAEFSGLVMVSALLGWFVPRIKSDQKIFQAHEGIDLESTWWFRWVQALLVASCSLLGIWIAVDVSFDGMGEPWALFGLTGRRAGGAIQLMLVGTSILMAGQTQGVWRSGWQLAAMVTGMLCTSSVGFASLEATTDTSLVWIYRSMNLMISAAMMATLTRFGLAKVLPASSDWIQRARQASPYFLAVALLMMAAVLIQAGILFTQ